MEVWTTLTISLKSTTHHLMRFRLKVRVVFLFVPLSYLLACPMVLPSIITEVFRSTGDNIPYNYWMAYDYEYCIRNIYFSVWESSTSSIAALHLMTWICSLSSASQYSRGSHPRKYRSSREGKKEVMMDIDCIILYWPGISLTKCNINFSKLASNLAILKSSIIPKFHWTIK